MVLATVPVPPRSVEDLVETAGQPAIDHLRRAAEPLRGARILMINSTAFGGGVAELLFTQVALLQDLGVETTWGVLEGSEDYFAVTKAVHNALQGAALDWTVAMETAYWDRIRANAERLTEDFDFVIAHDPQPAALIRIMDDEGRRKGKWIWRCHIDLSTPNENVWAFFEPIVNRYEGAIFTMEGFAQPGVTVPRWFVPPSIDPLSTKNVPISEDTAFETLDAYGVDRERPILAQVSRFDPWKDPIGVIDAFRIARERHPGLQLIMAGSMASDDPEGMAYLDLTEQHREGDPDIHLLSNLQGVGNLEINAFQRAADLVVQKSIREGFGLVVAEGMWKGKPVVAGNVGGITLQIEDGTSGFLVDSVEACAARISELLADPGLRDAMGEAGRERVRERFLTSRELQDYLEVMSRLA